MLSLLASNFFLETFVSILVSFLIHHYCINHTSCNHTQNDNRTFENSTKSRYNYSAWVICNYFISSSCLQLLIISPSFVVLYYILTVHLGVVLYDNVLHCTYVALQ